MKTSKDIFELLDKEFPEKTTISEEPDSEPLFIVNAYAINQICLWLRDANTLEFDTLMCLSGADEADGTKITQEEGQETVVGGNLSVYYHLYSIKYKHKITIKVIVPKSEPITESVESVWKCADWHEREAFDMFGIVFLNHPDLRRILMPDDWEGYPLRKDYVNPEFYQGIKIPY